MLMTNRIINILKLSFLTMTLIRSRMTRESCSSKKKSLKIARKTKRKSPRLKKKIKDYKKTNSMQNLNKRNSEKN